MINLLDEDNSVLLYIKSAVSFVYSYWFIYTLQLQIKEFQKIFTRLETRNWEMVIARKQNSNYKHIYLLNLRIFMHS